MSAPVDMGQKCGICDQALRDHYSTSAQCPGRIGSNFQQIPAPIRRECDCGRELVMMPVGNEGGLLPLCPSCQAMEFRMYDRRKEERTAEWVA